MNKNKECQPSCYLLFATALVILTWNVDGFSLQGLCPGLTHGQKYGISYLDATRTAQEDHSTHQRENVADSHSLLVVSQQSADNSLSTNKNEKQEH